MESVPFVLVVFTDGHVEAFEQTDADVFGRDELVLTSADGATAGAAAGTWLRATAYDVQGYPLYERRAAPPSDDLLPVHRAFVQAKAHGCPLSWHEFLLDHARVTLKAFYGAPITMSTLQPVLDLAVALNPEVRG